MGDVLEASNSYVAEDGRSTTARTRRFTLRTNATSTTTSNSSSSAANSGTGGYDMM